MEISLGIQRNRLKRVSEVQKLNFLAFSPFKQFLKILGFLPTNLCSLRTVKADIICGLKNGVAKSLDESNPTWMVTGEFGVLQFAKPN